VDKIRNAGAKITNLLITGNEGYIGSIMTPYLQNQGYHITGLDIGIFKHAEFAGPRHKPDHQIYKDVRDVSEHDFRNIDAVIHLAGLSNDPVGELNPQLTHDINHTASINLARAAKTAGVKRFLFSSSCSLYGISNQEAINESAPLDPKTEYAKSKALVEQGLAKLASPNFTPVYLRNATVFGVSPRLRLDLVVPSLTTSGHFTGKIDVLSDGTPWRPLVHLYDLSAAFALMLTLPSKLIHNQAFNVAPLDNNVQIKQIAESVQAIIPNTKVSINQNASPDERTYRVNADKLLNLGWQPKHPVTFGIQELHQAYLKHHHTATQMKHPVYFTLKHYQAYQQKGLLVHQLRVPQTIQI